MGIDIGTTNTKAVILSSDGKVETAFREITPFRSKHGAVFFDLSRLEEMIVFFKREIQKRYAIRGIAFSSVGESVVPVRAGKALSDPLFWNDPVTKDTAERKLEYNEKCSPELNRRGKTNHTFSLYKIIWMRETLGIDEADYWLSIPGYFVYRFTGIPSCDYSQATRTLLFDIGAGKWETRCLSRFDLENRLPALGAMDARAGEDREGIQYAFGGHDHITGLLPIEAITEGRPFIFDSIGSSESTVTLTDSRRSHSDSGAICMGAFGPGRFYALNAIIYSGVLMKRIAALGGNADTNAFFEAANSALIHRDAPPEKAFSIIAGGDPVAGLERSNLSFINFPPEIDAAQLAHTAYVYMAAMSRINIETLYRYTDSDALIVAGGGGTVNSLYMRYRAAIYKRPIHIIPAAEMSAIGASLCAAGAARDSETVRAFRQARNFTVVRPDYKWGDILRRQADDLLAFYRDMPRKTLLELCS